MVDAQYHHKATRAVHSFCLAKTQERIVFRWGVDAQLWSVAACCRFLSRELARGFFTREHKSQKSSGMTFRENPYQQAGLRKSGSKVPHSKA
jgi:hypothetical protein